MHELQDIWDLKIATSYLRRNSVGGAFLGQFSRFKKSEESWNDLAFRLKHEGLVRVPVVIKEYDHVWYQMYSRLSFSPWLARALIGSVDLLVGKKPYEIYDILQEYQSFRALRPNPNKIKDRPKKAHLRRVQLRNLSYEHKWQTVK